MKRNILASSSALLFFALSGPAFAQTPDSASDQEVGLELEEVIVTATRREVALQDVPLSITAFSQDELIEKGIVNYQGLAYNTPGVILNRQTQNFNNF